MKGKKQKTKIGSWNESISNQNVVSTLMHSDVQFLCEIKASQSLSHSIYHCMYCISAGLFFTQVYYQFMCSSSVE